MNWLLFGLGSYEYSSCVVGYGENCTGPNNEVIPHGATWVLTGSLWKKKHNSNGLIYYVFSDYFYQSTSAQCNGICTTEARQCLNGVLNGSFTEEYCYTEVSVVIIIIIVIIKVNIFLLKQHFFFFSFMHLQPSSSTSSSFITFQCSCYGPDGNSLSPLSSTTYYLNSVVGCNGSCQSQQRFCSSGILKWDRKIHFMHYFINWLTSLLCFTWTVDLIVSLIVAIVHQEKVVPSMPHVDIYLNVKLESVDTQSSEFIWKVL